LLGQRAVEVYCIKFKIIIMGRGCNPNSVDNYFRDVLIPLLDLTNKNASLNLIQWLIDKALLKKAVLCDRCAHSMSLITRLDIWLVARTKAIYPELCRRKWIQTSYTYIEQLLAPYWNFHKFSNWFFYKQNLLTKLIKSLDNWNGIPK
jgi:hypothetical protein